jgi:putative addiction module component (TIGR02574 family)
MKQSTDIPKACFVYISFDIDGKYPDQIEDSFSEIEKIVGDTGKIHSFKFYIDQMDLYQCDVSCEFYDKSVRDNTFKNLCNILESSSIEYDIYIDEELELDELDPELAKELEKRLKEIDEGKVKLIPWEEIKKSLKDRYLNKGNI